MAVGIATTLRAGAQSPPALTEYQVKAAYLYNFANLGTWPAGAFDGPTAPFRVCTAGGDVFGPGLADILRNESVAGHPVVLVSEPAAAALRRCHILFISARAERVDAVLAAVEGAAVLTVGEGDGFLKRGGLIEFAIDGGRVRFDVALRAATARGIILSSRLLQVARKVHQ